MPEIHVFTSAARNYLPKVRALCHSLRQHHPEWRLHLLLVDSPEPQLDLEQEPLDSVVAAQDLGIAHWQGWSFCHQLVELATAVKPFMFARLMADAPQGSKFFYFDPDMVVFSPLHDLMHALDEASILLTPHQTQPESQLQRVIDNEICALQHGIYNLGFLGLRSDEVSSAFIEWWQQRLYYFCRDDTHQGLFTDQRWIDLVPAFFPGVGIVHSPRHNVATWNLSTRQLQYDAGQYTVDGEPLGFFHFTGFDSGAHSLRSLKHLGQEPALKALSQWYTTETQRLRGGEKSAGWAFAQFSDGSPIAAWQRQLYRERSDLQRRFRDPYEASGYARWLQRHQPLRAGQAQAAPSGGALTAGFTAGEKASVDWQRVQQWLRAGLDPQTTGPLLRKGWSILRTEGMAGLSRRLR